ncbi:MAG: DUF2283 domain-containing protein [candidate division KSB1 bacterium]|nr:DUF2283 domain-containing protein [candidate division KSB1 bacterium]MDZ7364519.1 DUF2283 domain-containing protein [candidate division KSB1 bacterium]MDZ7405778.1 DUF2283 domain-containing protein [candidate division KSB1 bacterium]
MKVYYDDEVDAVYLKLSDQKPDGVVEIAEGVNLDTTNDGKLAGIEILKASKKLDVRTILSYSLELDKNSLRQSASFRLFRENKTVKNPRENIKPI